MGSFAMIAQTKRATQAAAARAVPIVANPETYRPTAAFFAQLRQYLGLTRDQVAAHLQTYPKVIAALETGSLSDLPPWPQTQRFWATPIHARRLHRPRKNGLRFGVSVDWCERSQPRLSYAKVFQNQ